MLKKIKNIVSVSYLQELLQLITEIFTEKNPFRDEVSCFQILL